MVGSNAPGSDFGGRGRSDSVWTDQGLAPQFRIQYVAHDSPQEAGIFLGEGASVIFVKQAGEPSRLVRRD